MEENKKKEIRERSAFDKALEITGDTAKTFITATAAGAGLVAGMYAAKKIIEKFEGDDGEGLVIEV